MQQNKIKVLIAEDSMEYGVICANKLRTEHFYVFTRRQDGRVVLDSIEKEHPDVVVMDAVMSNLDAIEVLKKTEHLQNRPLFIVTSSYESSFLQCQVMKHGAAYFMLKPFEVSTLANRILSLTSKKAEKDETQLITVITNKIREFGMPARLSGYHYLRTAVLLAIDDLSLLSSVTKRLYPIVAEKHNSTAAHVERSIRHAIEVMWTQGNPDAIASYFCCSTNRMRRKPTNSELIAMLVDDFRTKSIMK